ncbi:MULTISPECIES: glycosyltransferase family 25 protein [unclassified Meridianimarinicoccus]|uniref:glycosyltransferase family 25 protein n=1 Tax=unclassified Meridianimarinicoccus TaxID=2923344 RepID=UPI001868BA14
MKHVFTQVINLDSSVDRLATARSQLAAQGLPFSRTPAFDGRGKSASELPRYSPLRARLWFGRTLTGGEVGCFLSHRTCAERFLDSNAFAGLVLEDDLQLGDSFAEDLAATVDGLRNGAAPGWRLVNMGHALKANQPRRQVLTLPHGQSLFLGADFPLTTLALLWSREGAERFLNKARLVTGTVDNWLRSDMAVHGGGLFADPPLVHPVGTSVINTEIGAADIQKVGVGPRKGWYGYRSRQRSRWRRGLGERRLAKIARAAKDN